MIFKHKIIFKINIISYFIPPCGIKLYKSKKTYQIIVLSKHIKEHKTLLTAFFMQIR